MTLMTHHLPKYFQLIQGKITAKNDEDYKRLILQFLKFYRDNLNNEYWGEQFHFNPNNTITIFMLSEGLSRKQTSNAWLPMQQWVDKKSNDYTMKTSIISIPPRKMWDYKYWIKKHPEMIVINTGKDAKPGEFWWAPNSGEVNKYWYTYQSRWIPISLFSKAHIQKLADTFYAASRYQSVRLHVNKGLSGASADAIKRGRETSTNPAVYKAAAIAIMSAGSNQVYKGITGKGPNIQAVKKSIKSINKAMELITAITPNAGTYVNETNYFQKNWQNDFWGSHYARLLKKKQKYDPNGLFYCHHCVGSEYWDNSGMCRIKKT